MPVPAPRPRTRPRATCGPRPAFGILPLLTMLALLALVSAPGAAQDEPCADCHETSLADASVHAVLGCLDCHMEFDEELHPEEMSTADTCSTCHDAADVLVSSVHEGVACSDCHGPSHEVLPAADADSPVSPLQQARTCRTCHDDEGLIDGYIAGVHGRALFKSGLVSAPSCSSCHGVHDVLVAIDENSHLGPRRGPATCGECHRYVLETWREKSAHGALWTTGEDGPVCVTCHATEGGHGVRRPTERAMRLASPESCGECHGGRYASYRDSFHGEATDLGFSLGATCSDCHTPHENLAASDPRSSVHPDALGETCGRCHGETAEAFVTFDPHSDPSDPERNRPVYFVWLFMTSLLVAVFSFFGIHDLLWLQRAWIGWRRGELHEVRRGDEQWVRRFSSAQMRTHVVVVTTFLLLAATGLPLKFHYADWAQALTAYPGSVALLRLVHRIAAVFTFGYASYHVIHILRRTLGGERGLFWGFKSMVPRGKDLADLRHNLRYFFYLERQPRLDRWSYWEKFDYFAVFWGVPIIGVSGLMLWFPDFFTRFLPGWILNVAFVIHSDEALLATGFIFIFHFFHTHLRPESFPLDPVIFVGSMPLARFREERPVEYERLKAEGELEARLVDPPTSVELRKARTWGFTAVSIGLLLVLAILWSYLFY